MDINYRSLCTLGTWLWPKLWRQSHTRTAGHSAHRSYYTACVVGRRNNKL